jgi:hypothetical protein
MQDLFSSLKGATDFTYVENVDTGNAYLDSISLKPYKGPVKVATVIDEASAKPVPDPTVYLTQADYDEAVSFLYGLTTVVVEEKA